MPHHRANDGQCQLAAREELIFAAPPCAACWVPAAVHTVWWCSGSPAERVRFSGPDSEARTSETKQHFPDLQFFADRCWTPVLQKKMPNCKYTLILSLSGSLLTISGQRSQPPILGTGKRNVSASLLVGCATKATRVADPTVQPAYHQPNAARDRADPNGRPQQQPIFPPHPRSGSNRWIPTGGLATVKCGGRGAGREIFWEF